MRLQLAHVNLGLAIGVLFLGACDQDAGPRVLTDEELSRIALDSLTGDSASPLTQVVAILEVPEGTLVVDQHPPYLRVYGNKNRVIRTGGRDGDGPGELRRPWRATLFADTLFVHHQGTLSKLVLPDFEEVDRFPSLPGAISFHPECEGPMVYSLVLARGNRLTRTGVSLGLEWRGRYGPELQPAQFNPVGLHLITVYHDGVILGLDPFSRNLRRFRCVGSELPAIDIVGLEGLDRSPRGHGAAFLGDRPLIAVDVASGRAGTRLFLIDDTSQTTATIHGDYRVLPGDSGSFWLVRNTLEPTILQVRDTDMLDLLRTR